jgi:hypothetical protein
VAARGNGASGNRRSAHAMLKLLASSGHLAPRYGSTPPFAR